MARTTHTRICEEVREFGQELAEKPNSEISIQYLFERAAVLRGHACALFEYYRKRGTLKEGERVPW